MERDEIFEGVLKTEVADVEARSGACQSLDADGHGKVLRICAALRECVKSLVSAESELRRVRSSHTAEAKKRADAESQGGKK